MHRFDSPVLSIAVEAVSKVDGDEALFGLWTVFTKCKDSLQDGRRLENIAWRLWNRQVTAHAHHVPPSPSIPGSTDSLAVYSSNHVPPSLTLSSGSDSEDDTWDKATAVEEYNNNFAAATFVPSQADAASHLPADPHAPASAPTQLTKPGPPEPHDPIQHARPALGTRHSAPVPSHRAGKPIGRIISDILPETVESTRIRGRTASAPAVRQVSLSISRPPRPSTPVIEPPATPSPPRHLAFPNVTITNPTPRPTPPDSPRAKDESLPTKVAGSLFISNVPVLGGPSPSSLASLSSTASAAPLTINSKHAPSAAAPLNPPAADESDTAKMHKKSIFFLPRSIESGGLGGGSSSSSSDHRPSGTSHRSESSHIQGSSHHPHIPAAPDIAGSEASSTKMVRPTKKGKEPVRPAAPQRTHSHHRQATTHAHGHGHGHAHAHGYGKHGSGGAKVALTTSTSRVALAAKRATTLPLARTNQAQRQQQQQQQQQQHQHHDDDDGDDRSPQPAQPPQQKQEQKPKPAAPAHRREISPAKPNPQTRKPVAVATSSDFETTTDDSSWESSDDEAEAEGAEGEEEQAETGHIAREAAIEAARQRDMFAKLPPARLTENRRSGLLTELFHPDPAIVPYLPQTHYPFRAHHSAQNLVGVGKGDGGGGGGGGVVGAGGGGAATRPPSMRMMSSTPTSGAPLQLQKSKSSAAVSVAQVHITSQASVKNTNNPAPRPGNRLKGRPEGQQMETDDEEPDNGLSKSLAQRKLAQVFQKTSILNPLKPLANIVPPAPTPAPALQPVETAHEASLSSSAPIPTPMHSQRYQPVPMVVPPYPYNLPAPAMPLTPRTTRRQMLANEMSESLRRNLLWERQTSRRMLGGQARGGAGVLGNALRPLTSTNPGADSGGGGGMGGGEQQQQQQQQQYQTQGRGAKSGDEASEAERERRKALPRNKSWADEYHSSGW